MAISNIEALHGNKNGHSENGKNSNGRKWGLAAGVTSVNTQPRNLVAEAGVFGFKPEVDPLDHTVALGETDTGKILADVSSSINVTLWSVGISDDQREALEVADIKTGELNGHTFEGQKVERVKTEDDLDRFARRSVFIEDITGFIGSSFDNPIIAQAINGFIVSPRPAQFGGFGRIINVDYSQRDNLQLVVSVNGTTVRSFDASSRRSHAQLKDALDVAKNIDLVDRRSIHLPNTERGVTTLASEVAFMRSLRRYVMHNFPTPPGSVDEAIMKVLLSHTEKDVSVSDTTIKAMENRIRGFVKKGQPIPISLTFALGLRAPNLLKFREPDNTPTYGWLHFGNFLASINEKVQRVHEPGIRVKLFEESLLFGPLLGFSQEDIAMGMAMSKRLVEAVDAPIDIIPLEPSMFLHSEVEKIKASVDESRVYAIVCSRPDMTQEEVMDSLYAENARQTRDFSQLRQLAGRELWEDSRRIATLLAQHLDYRKKIGLFEKLLGGQIAIDATVTDKDERIVFDVTSGAMFNHAIPVVRRDGNGLHKVNIIPEYRISREFPAAKPVRIDRAELGGKPGMSTFMYELPH